MEPELCTIHASIDASRTRSLLEGVKNDRQRLNQLYTDCFFHGSIATAETAVLFAIKETDSDSKAIELADTLKSLPTAIPLRTAQPLAEICSHLAFSFSEEKCRAPLNTFCYGDGIIRRAALKTVFERLHDVVRTKPSTIRDVLKKLEELFDGMLADSEEIERRIVVGRLVELGFGMSLLVRAEIFRFLLEMDMRSCSALRGKLDKHGLEDFDALLTFELASLARDDKSMAQVLLRSLVRSLQYGTMDSLLTLWTCHRAQVTRAIRIIGKDSVLFIVLAHAARLAYHGNMSASRRAISIARHVVDCRNGESLELHEAVQSALITFCASIGPTSSACGDEWVNMSIAEILRCLRGAKTHRSAAKLREQLFYVSQDSRRWQCPETTVVLGLLLKIIELWTLPSQLKIWLEKYLTIMLNSTTISDEGGGSVVTSSVMLDEEPSPEESSSGETFGTLVILLGIAVLSHPTSQVRLEAVAALRSLKNSKISLFCLPSLLMHLQKETNGVIAVKIIREVLCSPSLLQDREASIVTLNACIQSLGQTTKDPWNSASYGTLIAALGYATESAPGLATALLLEKVGGLKESFGRTGGPVRASTSAAILRLVKSRPSRGTSFIPFISLCIAPESMSMVPEAASLCFEAINIMAEEEVLNPVKAVKIVVNQYSCMGDVEPKARRSYLKLLGAVSRASSTKKGVVLAGKVVNLLRGCLAITRLESQRRRDDSDCPVSWEEVKQAAQSLSHFTVEEILRLAHAADEPLLDIEAEAGRKEEIEKECQGFVEELFSLAAMAHDAKQVAVDSLVHLLIKITSHEWENRQRSRFDPDRIAKLQAASDALRRARQARGAANGNSITGIDGFARAIKGLPTGVIKGVFQHCIWELNDGEGSRNMSTFWIAIRVMLAAKAHSPGLPWVALVTEVMQSSRSRDEDRASCLAVLRALEDNSFELKDARSRWFGAQSSLFDSSMPATLVEGEELFIGMVRFYPSEVVRLLFKFRTDISLETISACIRGSRELHGVDINTAARGLFPVIMGACEEGNSTACASIERDFYEIILIRCEEPIIEELLLNNITESSAVRIACMVKSFNVLCEASQSLLAEGSDKGLLATVGMTMRSFDSAHRREFVLDMCSETDDRELRQRQYWLVAHVYGVAALLPYADLALSVAECFCRNADRDAVMRIILSIMQ